MDYIVTVKAKGAKKNGVIRKYKIKTIITDVAEFAKLIIKTEQGIIDEMIEFVWEKVDDKDENTKIVDKNNQSLPESVQNDEKPI